MKPGKKILILSANPVDTERLRLDEEIREIEECLRRAEYRDRFSVKYRLAVRYDDLRRALLDYKPQIVHFIGHGDKKGLKMEDKHGNAVLIPAQTLSGLFKLCSDHIECVLLSTCYSAPQANAISKHINYVIGMLDKIMDKAAIKFAVGFYDALGACKPVEIAFDFGCNAIMQEFPDFPVHLIPILERKEKISSAEASPIPENEKLILDFNSIQKNANQCSKASKLEAKKTIPKSAMIDNYDVEVLDFNTDKILSILRSNVKPIPQQLLRCKLQKKNKKYQLFEILITHIMSNLIPKYRWIVTPLVGDQGIDFFGEYELFNIQEYDLTVKYYIFGQCKIMKGRSNVINDIGKEVIKMKRNKNSPNYIIVALMADIKENVILREKRAFENQFQCPFLILGIREIYSLFVKYFVMLKPIFNYCLKKEECQLIYEYFQYFDDKLKTEIPVQIISPKTGDTGKTFELKVKIDVPLHIKDEFTVSWLFPSFERIKNYRKSPLELKKPHSMIYPQSLTFKPQENFSVIQSLKFQGYRSGEQSLGKLLIRSGEDINQEVNLGEIFLVEQYHPKFYNKPFRRELNYFYELISKTKVDNTISTLGVIGTGGSGKTRLCEAFGTDAENAGFTWISASHPNHLERPYKIFAALILNLIPYNFSISNPVKSIKNHIAKINEPLSKESDGTLNILFNEENKSIRSNTFNTEILIQLILTLILEKNSSSPICFHICDLHWCINAAFNIILEVIERLKTLRNICLKGIIFIFEGRVSEIHCQNSAAKDAEEVTVGWENFVSKRVDKIIEIEPFSSEDSKDFLIHLFENTQSPERQIPDELIIDQDLLIENILKFAEGNPFHMIEQIKLLKHSEIIKQNPRNGLLFLSMPLREKYEVPKDIRQLIMSRFKYIAKYKPKLAILIRAIALIKDRIDSSLYDHLKKNLAHDETDDGVANTEFITIPSYGVGEIRFRHENYYQTVRTLELNERDKIVKCYLDWIKKGKLNSPEALFDYGRILEYSTTPKKTEIKNIYLKGHLLASKKHQYQLSTQILERLINLYPSSKSSLINMPSGDILEYINHLLEFSKHLSWTVDWDKTKAMYKNVVEFAEYFYHKLTKNVSQNTLEKIELEIASSRIELANVEKQLMNNDKAIKLLNELITTLRSVYKNAESKKSELENEWANLLLRALNRLGVALWFNGHYKDGFFVLRETLSLSHKLKDPIQRSNQLRDFGTLYIHKNPKSAIKVLEKGISLLSNYQRYPKQYYLLQYQKIMAELILHCNLSDKEIERRFVEGKIDLLNSLFYDARRQGFTNEQGGSSLVLGVCCALIDSKDAIKWFKTSISISRRFGLMEFLWKGCLNLAQFCIELNISELEAAGLHAYQALEIIEDDLSKKKGVYYDFRYKLFQSPLDRIVKIFQILNDKKAEDIMIKYPELRKKFNAEIKSQMPCENEFENTALFVKKSANKYYLMN